ncbi:hypothetical protein DL93DRAFT_2172580 [Clavulina sp. PMI_390]|nr:hypothetical protein DL93DRAFT_2172580 [Clavulina sp. PMI_390]
MSNQLEGTGDPQPQELAPFRPFTKQFLPEIWIIIIPFLSDRSDLKSCSLTNRLLHHLTIPLIWTRFTLHLTRHHQFNLVEHLSSIIDNPRRARYISALRVLFLQAELESDAAIAKPSMNSPLSAEPSIFSSSAITGMIKSVLSLLPNVTYLTVVRVDRDSLGAYYPHFSSDTSVTASREDGKAIEAVDPLEQTVLRSLESWSSTIKTLRTNISLAQVCLSSTFPIHSLVLSDPTIRGEYKSLGRHMGQLSTPIRILEVEKMTLFYLTIIVIGIKHGGLCPNLQVIVHSSQGLEQKAALQKQVQTIKFLYHSFNARQPIHTFVLRVTDYPHDIWTGSEAPSTFASDLASSRLSLFEGRSPPPRVILELGTLGTPDFVCWIFIMESKDSWSYEREMNPTEVMIEREDHLYLSRN